MSETELLEGLVSCLELTNLDADCDPDAIAALCAEARTSHGNVAAVCILPGSVAQAKELLAGTDIKVATIVNFPDGGEDTPAVEAETRKALEDGADEIDLVMPYKALIEGRPGFAETQIVRIKRLCGEKVLKIILETGALPDAETLQKAVDVALVAGADFLKTSTATGVPSNAAEVADCVLSAIAATDKTVGFASSGSGQTKADAIACFEAAQRIRGDKAPDRTVFRIGATDLSSGLLAAMTDGRASQGEGQSQ